MFTEYWRAVFARAFTESLKTFDTSLELIALRVLGAFITAGFVCVIRGKQAFKEHMIANIAIAFGGAILTWACVFGYQLVRTPSLIQAESVERARKDAKREQKVEDDTELQRQLATKDKEIEGLKKRPGKPSATKSNEEIAAGLQKVYNDGQTIKDMLLNSDDRLSEKESNDQFSAWRSELRDYITQRISSGKAQYVMESPVCTACPTLA